MVNSIVEKCNLQLFEHMYIGEILMYLTWPLLILLSYFLIRFMLNRFEKNRSAGDIENQE